LQKLYIDSISRVNHPQSSIKEFFDLINQGTALFVNFELPDPQLTGTITSLNIIPSTTSAELFWDLSISTDSLEGLQYELDNSGN